MTIDELLSRHPEIRTDAAKAGVYVIPIGKHGYQTFPVGVEKTVTKWMDADDATRAALGEPPDDLPEVLKEHWGKTEVTETEFVLDEDAVLVSADDFEALRTRTKCWNDEHTQLIAYSESKELVKAKALIEKESSMLETKLAAQQWLLAHDYVGIKIAHVALTGTQEDIDALKLEYASVIEEANVKRATINECDAWLDINTEKLIAAKELVKNENA